MTINKITARPISNKNVSDFISEPENKKRSSYEYNTLQELLPWKDPKVRADVQKVFTVKLPEEFILKIKFISDKTNISQQKIIKEIICNEIDKKISNLIN